MIVFWIAAAAMGAAAAAMVLLPLLRGRATAGTRRTDLNVALYRDRLVELERELADGSVSREDYDAAQTELKRDLLANTEGGEQAVTSGGRGIAWVMAAAVPTVGLAAYLALGSPHLVDAPPPPPAIAEGGMPDVEEALAALEQRLQAEPEHLERWLMLGRSYTTLGRYEQAIDAYRRGEQALGPRPELLLGRAQAIALTRDQSLEGEPIALVRQVLEQDPDNVEALWLGGIHDFSQGDYARARERWQRVRAQVEAGTELAETLDQALAEVAARLGETPAEAAPAVAASLGVQVAVAPELAGQVPEEAVVFVFARVPGSRMPLAAERHGVGDLPLELVLDDADSMGGGSLPTEGPLEIIARVSRTGSVAAQPGDLEGSAQAGAGESVRVVIDRVVE